MTEAWGRGFDKIRAGCEEYGAELPSYEISDKGVLVFCKACPVYRNLLENDTEPSVGGEGNSEGKRKGKRREESAGKILNLLSKEATMTREGIAAAIGLPVSRVEKVIRQLRNEGKLVREGSSHNGRLNAIRR